MTVGLNTILVIFIWQIKENWIIMVDSFLYTYFYKQMNNFTVDMAVKSENLNSNSILLL